MVVRRDQHLAAVSDGLEKAALAEAGPEGIHGVARNPEHEEAVRGHVRLVVGTHLMVHSVLLARVHEAADRGTEVLVAVAGDHDLGHGGE